jgi:hypothetical protein
VCTLFHIIFLIIVIVVTIWVPKGVDVLLLIGNFFLPDLLPIIDEGIQIAIIIMKFRG